MLESEIFQFAADFAHAEAVRDGRIDFQRLARDALAALGAEAAERPHVVQPVGQLDDDDADIVHHRQQHLAIAFRLAVFGGKEIDLAQLGDAIDAARHFFAEVLLNVGGGDGGVFDDIVQQAGLDADHVHAHVGEDLRHRQRMHQIGLAGRALLAGVIPGREGVGLLDGGDVVFGAVIADSCEERLELEIQRGERRNGRYFGFKFDPFGGCHTSILVHGAGASAYPTHLLGFSGLAGRVDFLSFQRLAYPHIRFFDIGRKPVPCRRPDRRDNGSAGSYMPWRYRSQDRPREPFSRTRCLQ